MLKDAGINQLIVTGSRTNHDASLVLVEMSFGRVAVSEQFLKACVGNRVNGSTTAVTNGSFRDES